MSIADLLFDEKIIVAVIIGFSTMVVKYIISPLTKYTINRIKRVIGVWRRIEELIVEFRPNGGGSSWDKIDRIDKRTAELTNKQIQLIAMVRTVASSVGKGMITVDSSGNVDWVNERWYELTGITPNHAYGFGWLNGVHTDDRDWATESWMAAVKHDRDFNEVLRLQHDTTMKVTWVKMRTNPIKEPHTRKTIGWVGTITEVSAPEAA